MRSKASPAKASLRGAQGHANNNISKARDNAPLRGVKEAGRPTTTRPGKGLGKAGARRLGRLLKRAIPDQELLGRGKLILPKTPFRLFKHHVQTEAENAHKTNTVKPASSHISQLLLSVVSQWKNRGGITMAELKQMLSAEGYDVTKNNRRVNVVTNIMVSDQTLVRTTRNALYRLNDKKQAETKQVRITSVKFKKPKENLKQNKAAKKTPNAVKKSATQAKKTTKPKGKSHKEKVKTRRAASKSNKPKDKTWKTAAKSLKPRRKTPNSRTKPSKSAGKKHRSRTVNKRKAPRRVRGTQRHQQKRNRR